MLKLADMEIYYRRHRSKYRGSKVKGYAVWFETTYHTQCTPMPITLRSCLN